MAVVLIDSFSFRFNEFTPVTYATDFFEVYFNDINGTFEVRRARTYTNPAGTKKYKPYPVNTVNVAQRGKTPGQVISFSCNGFIKNSFVATLETPFVAVNSIDNSTDCGFIAPVPPPPPTPPPPPPVCDLVLTVTSTAITGLTAKDGTVTVTTNSVIESYYVVEIWKDGIVVKSATLYPIDTFVFDNLEKGDYIVKARAISFNCTAESNVTVDGFVFNERYWFEFCEKEFDKREIRISIKKAGYTGATTEIKLGDANLVEINYPTVDPTEKFYEILESDCTVRFIADVFTDLSDIYTDDERQYRLDLSFVATGALIWSGYILPDQSTIPFESTPYVVTIKATDGVKVLEDIPFDIFEGRLTWLQGIKYCLDKTDLLLPFKSSIDIQSVGTGQNVLLTGLTANSYGLTVIVDPGTWKVGGVDFTGIEKTLTLSGATISRYVIIYASNSDNSVSFLESLDKRFPKYPSLPANSILIARVRTYGNTSTVASREPLYVGDDTLSTKTFDVKRFGKEDGEFTDCYTVLKKLMIQYTGSLKQERGFWCIENIGNKSRNLIIKEFAYNNDLTVIYANQDVDLSVNVACGSSNLVLQDGQISIGAGYKKVTVNQIIGLPQPVIKNFNFETWIDDGGQEVPAFWQLKKPYGWFSKGAKIDRIYNPTTGEITEVQNGSYYFVIDRLKAGSIKSTGVAVFNQETINLKFQAVFANPTESQKHLMLVVGLKLRIGIYIFANNRFGKRFNSEPKWVIDDGSYFYLIEILVDEDKNQFNDSTNVSIEISPAPIQGFFDIIIDTTLMSLQFAGNKFYDFYNDFNRNRQFDSVYSPTSIAPLNLGIDNFKISKSYATKDVKIISNNTTTLENVRKFSTIPDAYETYFTDVDNVFRTDGIKDLNGKPTETWTRTGVLESETINVILARDILAQYQKTFRYFEGSIIGDNMGVRSVFNLPTFDLYRFVCNGGKFDLLNCTADLTIVEVYAEDGVTSAPIGGGTGAGGGGTVTDDQFVLGFSNKVLTDGNNNLFLSDGN